MKLPRSLRTAPAQAEGALKSRAVRELRAVPVLSAEEEAFLDAISSSGKFTLKAVLSRHAGVPALRKSR